MFILEYAGEDNQYQYKVFRTQVYVCIENGFWIRGDDAKRAGVKGKPIIRVPILDRPIHYTPDETSCGISYREYSCHTVMGSIKISKELEENEASKKVLDLMIDQQICEVLKLKSENRKNAPV